METRPGRVLRFTATNEFDDVRQILENRMGGLGISGSSALDYCIRSTLEGLVAKAENERKLASAAREYLLLLDTAESRSDLLHRQNQEVNE